MSLTKTPAWQALHRQAAVVPHLADLFAADAHRVSAFSLDAGGIYLDYSKQRASRETVALLMALAKQQGLSRWIERLFVGEAVNHTENRAALHMALRNRSGRPMVVGGQDVMPQVLSVLKRFCDFADAIRAEKKITDVVNIGIGGSDLGPCMVCAALASHADGPRTHFVSNVDPHHLLDVLRQVRPQTTLFIVASKTFTTQETMANANLARRWLVQALGEAAVAQHFVAVSTNLGEVMKFGIAEARSFGFWDWVGGRYSLWSAIGLPIALAIGSRRFLDLLDGAHAMDEHFHQAPLEKNLPVLMGLLSVWNINFLGAASQVLAPYFQPLSLLTPWLQQLEMESNGKGVDREGRAVDYATAPALWGGVGTNAQHAYFQMLHQGPALHPVDFIVVRDGGTTEPEQHRLLLANALAQSAALMKGDAAADPHRLFPGNRPSNTLILQDLSPRSLGALLALYEHRTFVQSVIWNVNPFDQWGVELGKRLTADVLRGTAASLDASTRELLRRLH